MKILWISNIPSPYRVDFFNELGKHCKLTVLFEKSSSDERDETWKKYSFSNFKGVILGGKSINTDKALCFRVISFLNNSKYDHIIVSNISSPTGIIAVLYMRMKKIPYWIEGDGAFAKKKKNLKEFVKTYIISHAKGCFSTSKVHDNYYLTYGAKKNAIFRYPFTSISEENVLKNTIPLNLKRDLRKTLGIKEDKVILCVGQMIPRKGIDIFIKVAALNKSYGFYIVGGKPKNEYLGLKKRLDAYNVHFVDFKKPDELKKYYQAANIFLLPTREDIWGLVINEAMANGLPVVTTDRCIAGTELVKNEKNGYVVPIEDVFTTSSAINKVFEKGYECMGKKSLEFIEKYTIENMAKAHINILGSKSNDNKHK
ncbi:glycosyltransferase family 4 protein [Ruminococcus albus]|uniref:Glycosyltransferase involved in cell wall bisynthesis n=1 Tax=Ruminococcus albus TaxID=1264 RepID=A0A1I1CW48_RUMAL|nr:glycosyltransferase family 4 protein [Ruminococcus albus]SFB66292.1 Glycosyltransferase involved in cell wall bisynthesis [Ruminococcus albus]